MSEALQANRSVMLSSTCYDLEDLRGVLHQFFQKRGDKILMSDRSTFPVDAGKHRHDTCVACAETANLLILVVDRRFGAEYYADRNISITWAEFRAAVQNGRNVLAFVRAPIWNERQTYAKNPDMKNPAHVDDLRTFHFLDEIQGHQRGIWIGSFRDVTDVVSTLNALEETGHTPFADMHNDQARTLSESALKWLRRLNPEAVINGNNVKIEHVDRLLGYIPATSGFAGVVMDTELHSPSSDVESLYYINPIRPADDDGSSWYAEAGPTAIGKAIREELKEFRHSLA